MLRPNDATTLSHTPEHHLQGKKKQDTERENEGEIPTVRVFSNEIWRADLIDMTSKACGANDSEHTHVKMLTLIEHVCFR